MSQLQRLGGGPSAWLRRETSGGILLVIAAAAALIWANSPGRELYYRISELRFGPAELGLNLSVAHWAADGLLAVFFFVVGAELKHEVSRGSLRHPRAAAMPVLAAVGGMIAPAGVYLLIVHALGAPEAAHGWAIPAATDIAFALAVLALVGRGLPGGVRIFLMTLAVVDDLLAIVVIAAFYSSDLNWWALLAALGVIGGFAALARTRRPPVPVLLLLAVAGWACMHASGVHATIAGVLLGLSLPATSFGAGQLPRTAAWSAALAPLAAGVAGPVFAFFAAGVTVVGAPVGTEAASGAALGGEAMSGAPLQALGQPVALAVMGGMLLGKPLGVLGTTFVLARFTPLVLPGGIGLRQLLPAGILTGIGFTVALLIAELSFTDPALRAAGKLGIVTGSILAAAVAALVARAVVRAEPGSGAEPGPPLTE